MINLRRSVILLILALVVFFNIEKVSQRLSLVAAPSSNAPVAEPLVNIDTFVYILGALAVASILVVPSLWHSNLSLAVAIWLAAYAVLKLWFNNWEVYEIVGGTNAYLTFTEIGMLVILMWRAYDVARRMHDFEEAVSNITFANLSRRIKKLDEAQDDIQTELIRSRRHHHPLTVMVVEPEVESIQVALNRTVQEVQRAMMSRYVTTSLARVISQQLRRTDLVVDQREKNRFIIVSPDTTAVNSAILADRIQAAAAVQLGVLVSCGVASFPDQALTFEELVQQAKSSLHSPAEIASTVHAPDETTSA